MNTSTPNTSPLRRKHSLVQNFISIEDDQNDLESEIQNRRLEAINKSTEARRKSTAPSLLAGLNANQLAQHCKDCIKLSTENKINAKNAFSFLLIDFMAAMAKKSDSDINKNFQIASCTLDASVKIYGYRVDAVHTDVMKLAGGFMAKDVGEVGSEEEGGEANHDNGDKEVKKKKKKKKRKMTVVNPESLNAKSEVEVLLDVVPRQNFLAKKVDGNDLLIKIPKYNDKSVLMIDSELPCWPYDKNEHLAPSFENKDVFDPQDLMGILNKIVISKNETMCPVFSNFEFGRDDVEEESEDELGVSQNSVNFEFDVNGSIQDVAMSEEDKDEVVGQRGRLELPAGGYDSGEEIVIAEACVKQTKRIAIGDMKKRISLNPLEYSLFDEKTLKSWAGPTYWKLHPAKSVENKENEDGCKQVAAKRTRKGKVKGPVGLFEVNEDILTKHLACGEKTILCQTTMLKWFPRSTTMPKDCQYSSKMLFTLFHMPSVLVEPKFGDTDLEESLEKTVEDDQEAAEELEYCSSFVQDGEPGPVEDEANEDSRVEVDTWDQLNMVAAPNKVEKITVTAFKRKKHVDIKQLKRGIWTILTDPDKKKKDVADVKVSRPVSFSELIKVYPSRMSSSLVPCLSAPLIFNALLHLTNEKTLILQQGKSSKDDFLVSQ